MRDITKRMKKIDFNKNEILINEFRELFENNKQTIISILDKENEILKSNYKYDNLFEIFNNVKDYPYDKLKKYLSIGTVACVTNGDTYFVMELILKALLTKTKIIFAVERYMISINTYLVELVQKVLEKHNISREAVCIYSMISYKDVVKASDNIDCIIVNKNYDMYKSIADMVNIKVIYSDYGNINIYSESADFDEVIKKVCQEASMEDKDIFLTKTDDIQNYVDKMNNNFVFYSVVIYTKNLEKCTYFLRNIKAENVYINKNPFEYMDVNFSEFELLYKKKITY